MATVAAPGFYASPRGIIATTLDHMGHQSPEGYSGGIPGQFLTVTVLDIPFRNELLLPDREDASEYVLGGNFGARRGRRFANQASI